MREKLNCPNCGAVIQSDKCPYCGSVFYDFSCIEIGKPIYIKVKHDNTLLTLRAVPKHFELNVDYNYTDAYDIFGSKITSFCSSANYDLSIELAGVQGPSNGVVLTVQKI